MSKLYIALLRGINVGGNNKVPMAQLKGLFGDAGFTEVVTYINSGNVIFSSDCETSKVQQECEQLLAENYPFKIPVMVISADDYREALAYAPSWWNTGSDVKHNALFVISPMCAEQVFVEIGDAKPEYEKVAHHGQVIFWSAPLKTFSRTRYSKIAGTPVYPFITIRNANTTLELAEIVAH